MLWIQYLQPSDPSYSLGSELTDLRTHGAAPKGLNRAARSSEPTGRAAAPEAGFTISQLLTVVVMFGLMMLIAVPKLDGLFRERSVETAADRLVLAHSLARSAALRYGRGAQPHVDAGNARLRGGWGPTGAGQRAIIGGVQTVSGGGLTFTATRTLLCFDARGLATTRTGCAGGDDTVIFTLGSRADTVTITALGKVLR